MKVARLKLGIFADYNGWHSQDLLRAATDRHELVFLDIQTLSGELRSESSSIRCSGHLLNDFDAVFARTIPAGTLEQIVFRMDALAELAKCGVAVVNSARAIEASVDKYLSLCLIQRAGVAVPRTAVCQTSNIAMNFLESMGGQAILKPVFGSEGRGLMMLDNPDLAARAFHLLEHSGQTIYLQEFVDHGNRDIRIFVAGQEMIAMQRTNPADWRTNAVRGAQTAPHQLTRLEREIAASCCGAVGAVIAGVDLAYDSGGKPHVLEVNSGPGWKRISETLSIDIAALVLNAIQTQIAKPIC